MLVSEIMLQQTQAARVVDRYSVFVDRWPTPAACAASTSGEVLAAWSGLGYPRRARNLLDAARLIVERHDGSVPGDLDELLALPGIGPYTARAVLAFAFERDGIGVVDTNIARVLARRGGTRLTARQAQQTADSFVAHGAVWAHNQSLMDLGALVCRPKPTCGDCPISAWCSWSMVGNVDPDPASGSAGVSVRQAPFAGSDRQLRGRMLRVLADGACTDEQLIAAAQADGQVTRVAGLVETLSVEGLICRTEAGWELGNGS